MRRLTLLVVLIAFTFSCGGQWYVLQGVAWANMIRDYSEMVPFTQAVKMTFSGQYPCSLCKAISEKKPDHAGAFALQQKAKKMCARDWVLPPRSVSISVADYPVHADFFPTRTDAPPTPPPRFV